MPKLSVVIITWNEEANIKRCLESVKWAAEIIIVDCGSTDKTLSLTQSYNNCRIINQAWLGFGKQKQFAVEQAANDWVLSLDADEELSTVLQKEIKNILQDPENFAYALFRRTFYLGKMIKHSGWQHDYPLRLFNKTKGNFNANIVHEYVIHNCPFRKLQAPLFHYPYPDLTAHLVKLQRYSSLGAFKLSESCKQSDLAQAVARGIFKFLKMYFIRFGFLDGKEGFLLASLSAYGVFLKYVKLWEINRSK